VLGGKRERGHLKVLGGWAAVEGYLK